MGVSGITRAAGMPVGTSLQRNAELQALRARIANVTNRIIVKYHQQAVSNAAISTVTQLVSQATGLALTHMGSTGTGAQIFVLEENLPLEEVQGIAHEIEANPTVEYAEPDKRLFPLYTPSDPRYSEQWHYYEPTAGVRLPEAWDTTTGEDIIVAVIDTGYTDHADLVDNLQLPGVDLINDTSISNDGDGRDEDAHDPGDWSPMCGWNESSWHGTHTTGTVAATGDNGIGVIGVAFNARVLPVRVLGTCGGWLSDIADGIIWAAGGDLSDVPANQTPAQVLNLSIGGYSNNCARYMQEAIDTARQLNSTVIVAAGNDNKNASGTVPANCQGVITVAATDRNGNRANFSNYGSVVDIAAPGVEVLSTLNTGSTTPVNDTYVYYDGTSMATPHVSGVAALLYAIKPEITPSEVEQILKDTVRPFPGTCYGCGDGLLDAAAAVEALVNTDPQPELIILENGVAQSNLSGSSDDRLTFAIDIPSNTRNLKIRISGGSGDADLYVQFGSEPTLSNYTCRPFLDGNNEACRTRNPQEGRYYVLIHGYEDFSGVSLLATYR
jgi:serine protease